jgi:hypothetical protein
MNDATLREASEQHDDDIRAPLAAQIASLRDTDDWLRGSNDWLRESNDWLRRELDAVRADVARHRSDLEATRQKLQDANDRVYSLRSELRDVKYHTDSKYQVKDRTHELERGDDTPRRRKLPRLGSRTSSTPLLPSVEPSLPTPAEPSPLAASDLASRVDGAAPSSAPLPASSITRRSGYRDVQRLTASQTRRA